MQKINYIPDVEEKIKKVFFEYSLKPKTPPSKVIIQKEKSYRTICRDKKDNKFFFKCTLCDDPDKIVDIKKEIFSFQSLKENNFYSKRSPYSKWGYRIQLFISCGRQKNFYWFLIKYAEGEQMGTWFAFKPKLITSSMIPIFTRYGLFIQSLAPYLKLTKNKARRLKLRVKDYNNFFSQIFDFSSILKKALTEKQIKDLYKEIKKNKSFLNKNCNSILHRDNHPQNILFNKKTKEFTIIDWSDLSYGSKIYDFTDIWVHAWVSPLWREELLEHFWKIMSKKSWMLLFKLTAICLTVLEMRNLSNRKMVACVIPPKQVDSFREKALLAHEETLRYLYKLK